MHVAINGVAQSEPLKVQQTAALIDNPFAPDIFATGFAGFFNNGGTILITFESTRCDHSREPGVLERMVVGRLALTVPAAQNLVAHLNVFLERQGLSPSRAVAGGATFQ